VGPSALDSGGDLRDLGFFDALKMGLEYDEALLRDRESIFHVFARTGFTEALRLTMTEGRDLRELSMDAYMNRSEYFVNHHGNHPAMEAAKHNQADALVLLLQPMVQLSMQGRTPQLESFVHQRNRQGHTLLYAVSHHSSNLYLPLSMVLHLEHVLHGGDAEAVQTCIKESLGSSKMSKSAVKVVKRRTPGALTTWLNYARIVIVVLVIPLAIFLVDMVTDAMLVRDYFRDMRAESSGRVNEYAEICRSNLTLTCYSKVPSGAAKFHLSVLIMIFPFIFYGVEVLKYYQPFGEANYSGDNRRSALHVRAIPMEERSSEGIKNHIRRKLLWIDERCSFFLCNSKIQPLRIPGYLLVWLAWPFCVFFLTLVHRYRLESNSTSAKIDKHSENVAIYQVSMKAALFFIHPPCLDVFCSRSLDRGVRRVFPAAPPSILPLLAQLDRLLQEHRPPPGAETGGYYLHPELSVDFHRHFCAQRFLQLHHQLQEEEIRCHGHLRK